MAIDLKPPDPGKVKKAIRLKYSILFDTLKWSTYKEVDEHVNHIFNFVRHSLQYNKRDAGKVKTHLKVILLNLYCAYTTNNTMYVAFPLGHDNPIYKVIIVYKSKGKKYSEANRYNPLKIGYTFTGRIVKSLTEWKYIENEPGFPGPVDFGAGGKVSRQRASSSLLEAFKWEGRQLKPYMIQRTKLEEVIELRAKKRVLTPAKGKKKAKKERKGEQKRYTDSSVTRKMRRDIKIINETLKNNNIYLYVTDDEWLYLNNGLAQDANEGKLGYADDNHSRRAPVDYSNKVLKRIFNDGSFKKGGRFYGGWWQEIPKECRKYITINYKETQELDYSGMHLNIIYTCEEIITPDGYDPYTIDDYEGNYELRELVKGIILRILNAEDKKSVLHSVRNDKKFNKEFITI